jgi:hypothetical protein
MNYAVIGIIILLVVIIYMLYSYFYAQRTILIASANLNTVNPAITNLSQPQNARYAYGVWVYVNNLGTNGNVIFSRANNLVLYLDKSSPTLYCDITPANPSDTSYAGSSKYTVVTNNFPVQKWCFIIVNVDGQFVDYYINGKLIKSEKKLYTLAAPPDINTPIHIGNAGSPQPKQYGTATANGAFDATIANFTQWSTPIDPQTAWSAYLAGNGQNSYTQYNADLSILKNQSAQTTIKLF